MGNRSYVIAEKSGEATILLEANNLLPLLWLAALPPAAVGGPAPLPTASPGIEGRAPVGYSMTPGEATAQLMRRKAMIEKWFGAAGSVIVDQFAALLNRDLPARIHLDLTEYIDLDTGPDSFVRMLQQTVAALDTDPSKGGPKRRPPAIKWLMDEFKLSGVAESAPLFGVALAGAMDDDSEPWRREPPRPTRVAGERLLPSNDSHLIAADGSVIVGALRNAEWLNTPVVWRRLPASAQRVDVPDNVGGVWVHHVSQDGSVLVGGCESFPKARYRMFRYQHGKMELLAADHGRVFLVAGVNSDASVLVGSHHSTDKEHAVYSLTKRAFRMEGGNEPVDIGPPDAISAASVVTPDGRWVGGYTERGPLETREQRAFVWSAEAGCVDLDPGFFMLDWVAISPDGQRGLLKYMSERGGPTGYQFWQRGRALQPIPELLDASSVRVSAAVDAVVARVPGHEAPMLWTCDAGARPIDFGAATGKLDPLYVADGAGAIVAEEAPPGASWGCQNLLIWKDGNVERHRLSDAAGGDTLGWRYVNRPPELNHFVTSGATVRQGVRMSWGLQQGLQPLPEA
ncbi:hypothetical protein SAMN05428959_104561 [Duganella sp. CF517]|uniref:hypothetical protein n=1 Tax=Duganella sp. CF517 TaxID=1881038 RepID=UPI0008AEB97B|nr:hypothetical protein [Duganella sp. CF517]SEO08257.1 hypothetical protein SAMN05428959_104561 [Duganella sp. CF517]